MFKKLILFFSCLLLLSSFFRAGDPSKLALIIAVGDYPESSGWCKLNSKNDVLLIRSALKKKGFEEKDILVVSDAKATKSGILEAFNDHLIKNAQKGGTAFFHFSGHGQQITDNNFDEIDQFDEALVPYDSPMHFQKDVYEGEYLLRDDELGRLLYKLRKKLGKKGNVLVVLDACHSGTATRGLGIARGTSIKMVGNSFVKKKNSNVFENAGLNTEIKSSRKTANMVAFFASGANELNYETRDQNGNLSGSLSYAFSKAFSTIENNTSYRGLFDKIKLEMTIIAPRQTPQAEGNLDYLVLGGKYKGSQRHFKVLRSFDDVVIVDGGTLAGLHNNTTFAFYPIDTKDTTKTNPLAFGTIQFAELFTSEIHLDRILSEDIAVGAWAFVKNQNFGEQSVRLQMKIKSTVVQNNLHVEISKYPLIQLVDSFPDLILRFEKETNQLILETKEAFVLFKKNMDDVGGFENLVILKVLNYAQSNYIRKLEMQDQHIDLELEIVPIKIDNNDEQAYEYIPLASKKGADGVLRFQKGDKFKIRIINNGDKPAYYSLLDIQPDNKINLILPERHLNRKAEEYYILPGQTHELPEPSEDYQNYWTFEPPCGHEVFKLIATYQPLNLAQTITTRGTSPEKSAHPFEILFGSTFKNKSSITRGSANPSIPPNTAQIYSLIFRIEK